MELRKNKLIKEDGRYLIYYRFTETAQQKKEVQRKDRQGEGSN